LSIESGGTDIAVLEIRPLSQYIKESHQVLASQIGDAALLGVIEETQRIDEQAIRYSEAFAPSIGPDDHLGPERGSVVTLDAAPNSIEGVQALDVRDFILIAHRVVIQIDPDHMERFRCGAKPAFHFERTVGNRTEQTPLGAKKGKSFVDLADPDLAQNNCLGRGCSHYRLLLSYWESCREASVLFPLADELIRGLTVGQLDNPERQYYFSITIINETPKRGNE